MSSKATQALPRSSLSRLGGRSPSSSSTARWLHGGWDRFWEVFTRAYEDHEANVEKDPGRYHGSCVGLLLHRLGDLGTAPLAPMNLTGGGSDFRASPEWFQQA